MSVIALDQHPRFKPIHGCVLPTNEQRRRELNMEIENGRHMLITFSIRRRHIEAMGQKLCEEMDDVDQTEARIRKAIFDAEQALEANYQQWRSERGWGSSLVITNN